MIIKAIVDLNERKGSSSRAIAKYIDATFSNLPHSHAALLVHHLRRLKKKGVLQMVKHSYKLPKKASTKTDAPKRGPGRPPKPKPSAGDAGLVKRGRGRPRKDPSVPKEAPRKPKVGRPRKAPLAAGAAAPRPRGRPPKKAKADGFSGAAAAPAAIVVPLATSPDATPPKVRGRPKKVKPDGAKAAADKKEKRPRGRPKKEGVAPSSEKRPRGRPKKAPAPVPAPAPVAVPIQTT